LTGRSARRPATAIGPLSANGRVSDLLIMNGPPSGTPSVNGLLSGLPSANENDRPHVSGRPLANRRRDQALRKWKLFASK
jgi:hypothetical protein